MEKLQHILPGCRVGQGQKQHTRGAKQTDVRQAWAGEEKGGSTGRVRARKGLLDSRMWGEGLFRASAMHAEAVDSERKENKN